MAPRNPAMQQRHLVGRLGRSEWINLGRCCVVVLCVCSVQSLMVVFASIFLTTLELFPLP